MKNYYNNWEENEYWVDLRGYPNYQISTYGRIRNIRNGKILKGCFDKDGYIIVQLGSDLKRVHRLMTETFYGEPNIYQTQVNHIDCNRANNHILNLEWCTPKDNIMWGVRYGYINPTIGLKKAIENNKKPVRIIETGQIFASIKDCAEYLGVPATNVSRVLVGHRKGQKLHGYKIEFVREEEL